MWLAEIDLAKQVLHVKFGGHMGPEEAKACAERIQRLLKAMQPGFVLMSDMSTLESMEMDCFPFIDQVMDDCNRHGVKKVIRIIPDPHKDIGFGIMSLFHYGQEVHVVTVKTVEEGRKRLG